jgi:carboxyl-terminal processing protease
MKRKISYGVLLTALAVNLFVGAQVYRQNLNAAEKDDPYPNLKLFSTVLERVRQDYVDGDKVTYQELIQGAMKGMLSTLDPHSEFMDISKYDELKKDTQGEFGGQWKTHRVSKPGFSRATESSRSMAATLTSRRFRTR